MIGCHLDTNEGSITASVGAMPDYHGRKRMTI
ncbi:hypothetical protein C7964_11155 [Loktanella sp. PT4BL]|jgi:hypothetical protein|nr:hypothetical protein C7964_11155 [Loktanella sp. PT4BL]